MRRVANGLSVLTMAALLMTAAACGRPTPAANAGQTPGPAPGGPADVDRASLPLAEPTRPAITELDARNVKAPPIFEVKAPANAPNVHKKVLLAYIAANSVPESAQYFESLEAWQRCAPG